jgi:3-phosphoshikimate 1-carboxyvinyltransferase
MTVRAAAACLLADGRSEIRNASRCDDGITAMGIIEKLGASTAETEVRDFSVQGMGKRMRAPETGVLDCRESGLCIRMFAPVVALLDAETRLVASGSLRSRPMKMLEALAGSGVVCRTEDGYAPVTVRGPMKGGHMRIDGSVSSQLLTGLLMALPLCEEDSRISVSNLRSAPYVRMTLVLLKDFGIKVEPDEGLEEFVIGGNQAYRPCSYPVEGDWSGAAFLLVAGAIAGSVTVTGLDPVSPQADRAILEALGAAGAHVEVREGSVSIEKGDLKPFQFDATECPDLFPPLVALASNCEGKSIIYGADRLAHKESDRASALDLEFRKLGIRIERMGNRMEVHGGKNEPAVVDSHNDHRIAMACAVAALCARGSVGIGHPGCVSKSYPGFFPDLESLVVRS